MGLGEEKAFLRCKYKCLGKNSTRRIEMSTKKKTEHRYSHDQFIRFCRKNGIYIKKISRHSVYMESDDSNRVKLPNFATHHVIFLDWELNQHTLEGAIKEGMQIRAARIISRNTETLCTIEDAMGIVQENWKAWDRIVNGPFDD